MVKKPRGASKAPRVFLYTVCFKRKKGALLRDANFRPFLAGGKSGEKPYQR